MHPVVVVMSVVGVGAVFIVGLALIGLALTVVMVVDWGLNSYASWKQAQKLPPYTQTPRGLF